MEKETITCELCGAEMTQLGRHLKTKHGIDGKEYQRKFPNAPLMSEARRKKNSDKSISPNNIEFWLKKGLSEKDAIEKIKVHKKKISQSSKKKSHFSLQYWIDKGFSEEEAKLKLSENNRRDEDYFVEKYGLKRGREKFFEMQTKKGYSNSKQRLLDDGFSESEIEHYAKKRWNQTSKGSFIKRFGESTGIDEYKKYCMSQKVKSKRSIEYWLDIGLSMEDAVIELKKFQSRGLSFWVEKYGEEKGMKKYKDWIEKIRQNSNLSGISKSSQSFFKLFFEKMNNVNNIQYYDLSGKEYCLVNEANFKLYLDCYFEYNGQKYGIEFNGDYWHANPKIYEYNDVISYPGKKMRAQEVWNRDLMKKKDFDCHNIKLFYVWESDFYDDSESEICKIINEIKKGN